MIEATVLPHLRRQLVIVRDPSDSEIAEQLSDGEREAAALLRSQKGREERLVSRVAAKIAFDRFASILCKEIEIVSDDRRPRCVRTPAAAPVPFLSISHSHGWGAALVAGVPCGVDIEMIRSIDARARKFYLNDDELPLLRHLGEDASVLLWSAKEAAWKVTNPETVKKVSLTFVSLNEHRLLLQYRSGDQRGRVEVFRAGNLAVAVAFSHPPLDSRQNESGSDNQRHPTPR